MIISAVARRRSVLANLLYRWGRLTAERGVTTLSAAERVARISEVRRLEEPVRELGRLIGGKTVEAEILKEAAGRKEAAYR